MAFFPLESGGTLFGGREPLYSEAGVPSLQTTHLPQHRLGLPPQDPARAFGVNYDNKLAKNNSKFIIP